MRCGLILAGGDSVRIGMKKHSIIFNGKSMIEMVTNSMQRCGYNDFIISTKDGSKIDGVSGVFVRDDSGFYGPQAGLFAGLEKAVSLGFEWVQIAPCDMPLLGDVLLDILWRNRDVDFGAIVPEDEYDMQPLLALVQPAQMLDALQELKGSASSSIFSVLKMMSIKSIKYEDLIVAGVFSHCFVNVNTDDEILEVERILKLSN